MAKHQAEAFGSGQASQKKKPVFKMLVVLLFVLLISGGILFIAGQSISEKDNFTMQTMQKRMALLADGRAKVMETWLDGLSREGDRLIKSDLFRMFAAEVEELGDDMTAIFGVPDMENSELSEDDMQIAAQLPMMQNMLREFSTYTGFLTARILNTKGQAYIATDGYLPPLGEMQLKAAAKVVSSSKPAFSPLRKTEQGLVIDTFVPIMPPDSEGTGRKPVGVLMMTRQVTGKITELLSNSAISAEGERTRLMQKENGHYVEILPWTSEGLAKVTTKLDFTGEGGVAFAVRSNLVNSKQKVYSLGVKLGLLDWWIVQEDNYRIAREPVESYTRTVYIVAAAAILIVFLCAGLIWWILIGLQSQRTAKEYEDLACKIDDQKRFINSINAAVDEFITLKDLNGKYTYVNDAFAGATGRTKEELIGMDDAAIFGFDTGKRLSAPDKKVCDGDEKVTIIEAVFLRSQKYHFQISKSPYRDASGACLGVVSVYRDITEFITVQENNKKLIQRAMMVLIGTIEAADPHLGGHSKLLSEVAVKMGRVLNLRESELAQLETAANLSQIGKVFVPKEILSKPGRLTDEEKHTMEQHVEHAHSILTDIDIGEEVTQAVYQMNERMDGSGYPKGLKSGEISLQARILGIANAFCAMIKPRVYRGAKTTGQALDILVSEADKFDGGLVEALRKVTEGLTAETILPEGTRAGEERPGGKLT